MSDIPFIPWRPGLPSERRYVEIDGVGVGWFTPARHNDAASLVVCMGDGALVEARLSDGDWKWRPIPVPVGVDDDE